MLGKNLYKKEIHPKEFLTVRPIYLVELVAEYIRDQDLSLSHPHPFTTPPQPSSIIYELYTRVVYGIDV